VARMYFRCLRIVVARRPLLCAGALPKLDSGVTSCTDGPPRGAASLWAALTAKADAGSVVGTWKLIQPFAMGPHSQSVSGRALTVIGRRGQIVRKKGFTFWEKRKERRRG